MDIWDQLISCDVELLDLLVAGAFFSLDEYLLLLDSTKMSILGREDREIEINKLIVERIFVNLVVLKWELV